ncbi:MAG: tyrosine-type recombinase/integrase, partial [Candidatus Hodarchaeota archaeon]
MRVYKPSYSRPLPTGVTKFTQRSGTNKGVRFCKFTEKKGHTKTVRLTRNGRKILCETKLWHIQFEDNLGITRDLKAYTDRQATQRLADFIDILLSRRQIDNNQYKFIEELPVKIRNQLAGFGLLDGQRTVACKMLEELIDEFEEWMKTTKAPRHGFKRAKNYIKPTCSRIRTIAKHCKFKYWSDIRSDLVEKYLSGKHISKATYNSYVTAIKIFCNWMYDNQRVSESPLRSLKPLTLDRKEYRRALEPDEVHRLLEATRKAPFRHNMSGVERSILYLLLIETGLRRGELMSLTVSSFELDKCTVTVEPENFKGRRKAVRYLKQKRANELREFFKGKLPNIKPFNVSDHWRSADMIREDLEETEQRGYNDELLQEAIPFVDENGRRLDLHALRHTYITALDGTDASLAERKVLAGHSLKGDLTLGTYTHPSPDRLRDIVEQLPDYDWPKQLMQQKATGTDGNQVDASEKILSKSCFQSRVNASDVEKCTQIRFDTDEKTQLRVNNEGSNYTHNPLVVGSNPTGPIIYGCKSARFFS